ncbi:MAG: PHP domain-containing protein [Deltaproteobacteria bacterium]|nr:PHP domain-containing protein [Deltaproteobacteria bacterium]
MKLTPLKADLHIHTQEDPVDRVLYTARELILMAAVQGFEVLSITNHNLRTFDRDLFCFARDQGILLIPGMEIAIQNRHVLILNPPENKAFTDFSSLADLKRPDCLVIAPHPFFPALHSINGFMRPYFKMFDALEFSHFYLPYLNFNRRALEFSRESGLPLLGTSDAHFLEQLGTTYSLIHAPKDMESVFSAIRQGKIELVTKPLSPLQMGRILGRFWAWKLLAKKKQVKGPRRY